MPAVPNNLPIWRHQACQPQFRLLNSNSNSSEIHLLYLYYFFAKKPKKKIFDKVSFTRNCRNRAGSRILWQRVSWCGRNFGRRCNFFAGRKATRILSVSYCRPGSFSAVAGDRSRTFSSILTSSTISWRRAARALFWAEAQSRRPDYLWLTLDRHSPALRRRLHRTETSCCPLRQ